MAKKEIKTEGITCPINPKWIVSMLTVLPPGSRGKLEPYINCDEVKEGLRAKAKELGKTLTELGFNELEEES
jgi:hypothetical protein